MSLWARLGCEADPSRLKWKKGGGMLRIAILILFSELFGGTSAYACEPAHLQFEGTPFVAKNIQLENQRIYFFRGESTQTVVEYSAKNGWCFTVAGKVPEKPNLGCLKVSAKRAVRLRDAGQMPVATLQLKDNSLMVNVLSETGKNSGKQIQFTAATENGERIIEVKAWNCPNPRFLSCAGADLKVLPAFVSVVDREVISGAIELAKGSNRYQVSCRGAHAAPHEFPDIGRN